MPQKFLIGVQVIDAFLPAFLDDLHLCQGPDCGLLFQWDAKSKCAQFDCPMCKGSYCIKCKALWSRHTANGNCPSDADTDEFKGMIAAKKYRQCNDCGVWLERNGGCPYVTCKCGNKFCWICGVAAKSRRGWEPGCTCQKGHGYIEGSDASRFH
jgi:hypothetical protein